MVVDVREHADLGLHRLADQQVGLPVARNSAVFGYGRTLVDSHHVQDPAPGLWDRLGRHPPSWVIGVVFAKSLGDLLGRPVLLQKPADPSCQGGTALQREDLGSSSALTGPVVGDLPVVTVGTSIAVKLATDRGWSAMKFFGDRLGGEASRARPAARRRIRQRRR